MMTEVLFFVEKSDIILIVFINFAVVLGNL